MLLSPPPHDAAGKVVPHDHTEIKDQDVVIRGIMPGWIVDDPKVTSGKRISSLAFKASSGINGGMSVNLKALIELMGLNPYEYVTNVNWPGSIMMNVGGLRGISVKVGYDPLPENPCHCELWANFNRSKMNELVGLSTWFVSIPGVEIHRV